jgi:hypothetical protein
MSMLAENPYQRQRCCYGRGARRGAAGGPCDSWHLHTFKAKLLAKLLAATAAAEPFAYAVSHVQFLFDDDTGPSCMPTKLGRWVCSNCWWLLLLFPADLPAAAC